MKKDKIIYLMVSVWLFVLSGCDSEVQIASSEPLCMRAIRKAQLMEVCEDILVRKQFVIEKYDLENGFIKTRPLSGKQFFEFWRSDNAGSFNSTEANIQSIQRSVIINIQESKNQLCIDCDVSVQRLSIPEQDILGMRQTSGTFTHSSDSLQKLRLRLKNEQQEDIAVAWMDIGTDGALERVILEQIEKKINKLENRTLQ